MTNVGFFAYYMTISFSYDDRYLSQTNIFKYSLKSIGYISTKPDRSSGSLGLQGKFDLTFYFDHFI